MSESGVASYVRLDAANRSIDLWRNNVGVLLDINGRPVRYGLANDSKAMNKLVKSSDLIGVTPIMITPDMVGQIVGVFTAVETKHEDWKFKPSDSHSVAQKNFHDIVKNAGGYAGFATCVPDFRRIVGHEL